MHKPKDRGSSRLLGAFALLVGMAWGAQPVPANPYHYKSVLVGDRAMGMGGAYTAVADDPAGLYYNPAGIVYRQQANLSGSVNAFHQTSTTYEGALGNKDWERSSTTLLPNFFGVIKPLGNVTTGFSLVVPESMKEDQDEQFQNVGEDTDTFGINFNHQLEVYKIGPSFAMPLTESLSVGLSLYGHYRTNKVMNNQWTRADNGNYEWWNHYYESEEAGLQPVLGVMWSPVSEVSLGWTLRKTEVLYASNQTQVNCVSNIPDNENADCYRGRTVDTSAAPEPGKAPGPKVIESDVKRELPWQTGLGVAFFPSSRMVVSLDGQFYSATNGPLRDRTATWNLSAGTEYYLTGRWAVRGGLYTNRANTPELEEGEVNQDPHVNYVGGSLSLSRFTRNSSMTGGISFSRGQGEAQVVGGKTDIQDVSAQSRMVYISTSYAF